MGIMVVLIGRLGHVEGARPSLVCAHRTYGPLIKSPVDDLPEDTQQDQSATKDEDS
jgi:hypothetical protein